MEEIILSVYCAKSHCQARGQNNTKNMSKRTIIFPFVICRSGRHNFEMKTARVRICYQTWKKFIPQKSIGEHGWNITRRVDALGKYEKLVPLIKNDRLVKRELGVHVAGIFRRFGWKIAAALLEQLSEIEVETHAITSKSKICTHNVIVHVKSQPNHWIERPVLQISIRQALPNLPGVGTYYATDSPYYRESEFCIHQCRCPVKVPILRITAQCCFLRSSSLLESEILTNHLLQA
jgi:hypothetical protein